MITVEKYIEVSKIYNDACDKANYELQKIIYDNRSACGLVNEETKKTKRYIDAKNSYNFAFNMMKKFNKTIPNKIKREASKVRRREKWGI